MSQDNRKDLTMKKEQVCCKKIEYVTDWKFCIFSIIKDVVHYIFMAIAFSILFCICDVHGWLPLNWNKICTSYSDFYNVCACILLVVPIIMTVNAVRGKYRITYIKIQFSTVPAKGTAIEKEKETEEP